MLLVTANHLNSSLSLAYLSWLSAALLSSWAAVCPDGSVAFTPRYIIHRYHDILIKLSNCFKKL